MRLIDANFWQSCRSKGGDRMNNENAIRVLEEFKIIDDWTIVHLPEMEDAVDVAIEALKVSEIPTGSDLISRQDAWGAIEHWGRSRGNLTNNQIAELQREIESLPSAPDSRQRGEWTYLHGSIGSYMTISCPFCGVTFNDVAEWEYNFCSNCGADMRGEEE